MVICGPKYTLLENTAMRNFGGKRELRGLVLESSRDGQIAVKQLSRLPMDKPSIDNGQKSLLTVWCAILRLSKYISVQIIQFSCYRLSVCRNRFINKFNRDSSAMDLFLQFIKFFYFFNRIIHDIGVFSSEYCNVISRRYIGGV